MRCLELKESFSVEWSDLHGEFAPTYRPRGTSVGEQGVKSPTTGAAGSVQVGLQSADVALRTALKAALMGSGRDDVDDIVEKISEVYKKTAEDPRMTLSAVNHEERRIACATRPSRL